MIFPKLLDDIKTSMKAGQKETLLVLRLIHAEFKSYEINERKDVSDDVALSILSKMQKQRRASIEQFDAAGRIDLSEKEHFELEIIQRYMPKPLSESELEALIGDAIKAHGNNMGAVMKELKPKTASRADGAKVSSMVKTMIAKHND